MAQATHRDILKRAVVTGDTTAFPMAIGHAIASPLLQAEPITPSLEKSGRAKVMPHPHAAWPSTARQGHD
jgi:hypothetical protein